MLAAAVLVPAGLVALWAAEFRDWHSFWGDAAIAQSVHVDCSSISSYCSSTRPGWAIPVAIAIGLGGILVAALLYRPRSTRAAALSGQPAILRSDGEQAAAWGLAPPHA